MKTGQDEKNTSFGIGAVSRLTGIPLDTLRVWERRYQLVAPSRTGDNRRKYSRADVVRLGLIKKLVDHGHAISAVAHLSEDALRERLDMHKGSPPPMSGDDRRPRVLIHGESLPFLAEHWTNEWNDIEVVGIHTHYADFGKDAITQKPDVLILETPSLQAEAVAQFQQLKARSGAKRAVVVYGFGMKPLLESLSRGGVVVLRAPVSARVLAQACRVQSEEGFAPEVLPMDSKAIPARRFDSETLSLITRLPTSIRCECPQHLGDLLFRLTAFEAYSADCENRNEQDAALHAHLHRETAKARAQLEDALEYLIKCEQIDLSSPQSMG